MNKWKEKYITGWRQGMTPAQLEDYRKNYIRAAWPSAATFWYSLLYRIDAGIHAEDSHCDFVAALLNMCFAHTAGDASKRYVVFRFDWEHPQRVLSLYFCMISLLLLKSNTIG